MHKKVTKLLSLLWWNL